MELTAEQEKIVGHEPKPGDDVIVNAYAGTGKTKTCLSVIARYPEKKWLYIVFNANMQKEAEKRKRAENMKRGIVFDCRTTHSLAMEFTRTHSPGFSLSQRIDLFPYTNSLDPKDEKTKIGRLAVSHLKEFFTHKVSSLDYFFQIKEQDLSNRLLANAAGDAHRTQKQIDELAEARKMAVKIWEDMRFGRAPYTHDAYLKYFCTHSKTLEWISKRWDCVILDEAQDTNTPLANLLVQPHPEFALYLVGDQNQSIYAFRHCVNIMAMVAHEKRSDQKSVYALTRSFRFGPEIGALATTVLLHQKGSRLVQECGGPVVGAGPWRSHVHRYTSEPPLKIAGAQKGQFAAIARTNASAFTYAYDNAMAGHTVFFTSGRECLNSIKEIVAEFTPPFTFARKRNNSGSVSNFCGGGGGHEEIEDELEMAIEEAKELDDFARLRSLQLLLKAQESPAFAEKRDRQRKADDPGRGRPLQQNERLGRRLDHDLPRLQGSRVFSRGGPERSRRARKRFR